MGEKVKEGIEWGEGDAKGLGAEDEKGCTFVKERTKEKRPFHKV